MKQLIVTYLPYLLSVITIWMTFSAGSKRKNAWLIGLPAQALWLVWIVVSESLGFLPMNAAMWIVCVRNHLKWNPRSHDQQVLDDLAKSAWDATRTTSQNILNAGNFAAQQKHHFSEAEMRAATAELDSYLEREETHEEWAAANPHLVSKDPCMAAPRGWRCAGGAGHGGPCAARRSLA